MSNARTRRVSEPKYALLHSLLNTHCHALHSCRRPLLSLRSRVAWRSADDAAVGYSLLYPDITLHAVCRDTEAFPEPCLFLQLAVDEAAVSAAAEEAGAPAAGSKRGLSSTPDLRAVDEIRFVPETDAASGGSGSNSSSAGAADAAAPSTSALDDLFSAMSACAELHPDPMNEEDADFGGGGDAGGMFGSGAGGWFASSSSLLGGEAGDLSEEQSAALAALEARIVTSAEDGEGDAQFEDAEEEAEEAGGEGAVAEAQQ